MEYRIGKCSQCGAEYKVPSSFAHNVARCKVCKGVVHLGQAPEGDAAPAAPAGKPAEAPTPPPASEIPARKPAPKAPPSGTAPTPPAKSAPRPASRPAETPPAAAEAPKKKGGTLARLKAERAAAAKAGEGGGAAAAAPKPKPKAAAVPAPAKARSRTRARDEEEEDEGVDERGRSRSRRSSRRRGSRKKEKGSPVLPLVSLAVLIVMGWAIWNWRHWFLAMDDEEGTQEVAEATQPDPDASATEEPQEEPEEIPVVEPDAPAEEPEEAPAEPEEPKEVDPDSIDLRELADFGPVDDTSPEEWTQMNEWMLTWMDVSAGAAGNRAKARLEEMGRKAFPVILNHFKTLDFGSDEGRRNGDLCQRTLMGIVNGTNFDWRYTSEPEDELFNKQVVKAWAFHWEKSEDNVEYWIKFAKLDDKDPKEAERLRDAAKTGIEGVDEAEDALDVD
jgi:hypothetical protein